ncbi:hypothetical protein CEUSTIGMA_g9147.t1 [Chlamydomonas eustigma]|uniref:Uncharacterized protein n=1 Tax=Chlamydomonas eustigma TaxID=1157962 RepID=A0A250XFM5_9CHLO|nr:hypothetical protein CEUSTIGMA_g9147.t1 [Chlamydomonas eustigma]|eukprot:GAX81719.1 hypothetical protein CEUSTIGMA_g9147.t1 [Chlamydomonas eustigma]
MKISRLELLTSSSRGKCRHYRTRREPGWIAFARRPVKYPKDHKDEEDEPKLPSSSVDATNKYRDFFEDVGPNQQDFQSEKQGPDAVSGGISSSGRAAKRLAAGLEADMLSGLGSISLFSEQRVQKVEEMARMERLAEARNRPAVDRSWEIDLLMAELADEGFDLDAEWGSVQSRTTTTAKAKITSGSDALKPVKLVKPPRNPKFEAMRKEEELRRRARRKLFSDGSASAYLLDGSFSSSSDDESSARLEAAARVLQNLPYAPSAGPAGLAGMTETQPSFPGLDPNFVSRPRTAPEGYTSPARPPLSNGLPNSSSSSSRVDYQSTAYFPPAPFEVPSSSSSAATKRTLSPEEVLEVLEDSVDDLLRGALGAIKREEEARLFMQRPANSTSSTSQARPSTSNIKGMKGFTSGISPAAAAAAASPKLLPNKPFSSELMSTFQEGGTFSNFNALSAQKELLGFVQDSRRRKDRSAGNAIGVSHVSTSGSTASNLTAATAHPSGTTDVLTSASSQLAALRVTAEKAQAELYSEMMQLLEDSSDDLLLRTAPGTTPSQLTQAPSQMPIPSSSSVSEMRQAMKVTPNESTQKGQKSPSQIQRSSFQALLDALPPAQSDAGLPLVSPLLELEDEAPTLPSWIPSSPAMKEGQEDDLEDFLMDLQDLHSPSRGSTAEKGVRKPALVDKPERPNGIMGVGKRETPTKPKQQRQQAQPSPASDSVRHTASRDNSKADSGALLALAKEFQADMLGFLASLDREDKPTSRFYSDALESEFIEESINATSRSRIPVAEDVGEDLDSFAASLLRQQMDSGGRSWEKLDRIQAPAARPPHPAGKDGGPVAAAIPPQRLASSSKQQKTNKSGPSLDDPVGQPKPSVAGSKPQNKKKSKQKEMKSSGQPGRGLVLGEYLDKVYSLAKASASSVGKSTVSSLSESSTVPTENAANESAIKNSVSVTDSPSTIAGTPDSRTSFPPVTSAKAADLLPMPVAPRRTKTGQVAAAVPQVLRDATGLSRNRSPAPPPAPPAVAGRKSVMTARQLPMVRDISSANQADKRIVKRQFPAVCKDHLQVPHQVPHGTSTDSPDITIPVAAAERVAGSGANDADCGSVAPAVSEDHDDSDHDAANAASTPLGGRGRRVVVAAATFISMNESSQEGSRVPESGHEGKKSWSKSRSECSNQLRAERGGSGRFKGQPQAQATIKNRWSKERSTEKEINSSVHIMSADARPRPSQFTPSGKTAQYKQAVSSGKLSPYIEDKTSCCRSRKEQLNSQASKGGCAVVLAVFSQGRRTLALSLVTRGTIKVGDAVSIEKSASAQNKGKVGIPHGRVSSQFPTPPASSSPDASGSLGSMHCVASVTSIKLWEGGFQSSVQEGDKFTLTCEGYEEWGSGDVILLQDSSTHAGSSQAALGRLEGVIKPPAWPGAAIAAAAAAAAEARIVAVTEARQLLSARLRSATSTAVTSAAPALLPSAQPSSDPMSRRQEATKEKYSSMAPQSHAIKDMVLCGCAEVQSVYQSEKAGFKTQVWADCWHILGEVKRGGRVRVLRGVVGGNAGGKGGNGGQVVGSYEVKKLTTFLAAEPAIYGKEAATKEEGGASAISKLKFVDIYPISSSNHNGHWGFASSHTSNELANTRLGSPYASPHRSMASYSEGGVKSNQDGKFSTDFSVLCEPPVGSEKVWVQKGDFLEFYSFPLKRQLQRTQKGLKNLEAETVGQKVPVVAEDIVDASLFVLSPPSSTRTIFNPALTNYIPCFDWVGYLAAKHLGQKIQVLDNDAVIAVGEKDQQLLELTASSKGKMKESSKGYGNTSDKETEPKPPSAPGDSWRARLVSADQADKAAAPAVGGAGRQYEVDSTSRNRIASSDAHYDNPQWVEFRELRAVFNNMKRSGILMEVDIVGWSRGEFLTEILLPAGSELERAVTSIDEEVAAEQPPTLYLTAPDAFISTSTRLKLLRMVSEQANQDGLCSEVNGEMEWLYRPYSPVNAVVAAASKRKADQPTGVTKGWYEPEYEDVGDTPVVDLITQDDDSLHQINEEIGPGVNAQNAQSQLLRSVDPDVQPQPRHVMIEGDIQVEAEELYSVEGGMDSGSGWYEPNESTTLASEDSSTTLEALDEGKDMDASEKEVVQQEVSNAEISIEDSLTEAIITAGEAVMKVVDQVVPFSLGLSMLGEERKDIPEEQPTSEESGKGTSEEPPAVSVEALKDALDTVLDSASAQGAGPLDTMDELAVLDSVADGTLAGALEGALQGAVYGAVGGAVEGAMEGVVEGAFEGVMQGALEGAATGDGSVHGVLQGALDAVLDNAVQGAVEGLFEGAVVGAIEGAAEGALEGALSGAMDCIGMSLGSSDEDIASSVRATAEANDKTEVKPDDTWGPHAEGADAMPLASVADQVAAIVAEAFEDKVASLSDMWDSFTNVVGVEAAPESAPGEKSGQSEAGITLNLEAVISSISRATAVVSGAEANVAEQQQQVGSAVPLSAGVTTQASLPVLMKQRIVADKKVESYHEQFSGAFHMKEGLLDEERVVKTVMIVSKTKAVPGQPLEIMLQEVPSELLKRAAMPEGLASQALKVLRSNTGAEIIGEVVHVLQHGLYLVFDLEIIIDSAPNSEVAPSGHGSENHESSASMTPSTDLHSVYVDRGSQSGVETDRGTPSLSVTQALASDAALVQETTPVPVSKQIVPILGYFPDSQVLRSIQGIRDSRDLCACFKVGDLIEARLGGMPADNIRHLNGNCVLQCDVVGSS